MDGKLQSPSTWQRYKLGQARVTDWLKQTACNFVPSPTPPDASEGNGSSTSTKKPKLDSASDKVHWSELEHMAETIANNSKPEEIPWDPILVLRDVVALRKKSARFHSKKAEEDKTGKLKISNQQHDHIIKVLEKVLNVLESAVSGGRPKEKEEPRRAGDHLDMKLLDNMFNLLQFEKPGKPVKTPKLKAPEEEEEGAPKAKAPGRKPAKKAQKKGKGGKGKKSKKASKHKGGAKKSGTGGDSDWVDRFSVDKNPDEDDDEELDHYVLIYCFFEDFNTIRNYVAERWADYFYDKSVSLNTLAVITNAAAELFRNMEIELCDILDDDYLSYEAMMELLFYEYGIDHVDYNDQPDSKDEQHEKDWREEADWLAYSTYVCVKNFLENMPLGNIPVIPPSSRVQPMYSLITSADFVIFNGLCILNLFPEIEEFYLDIRNILDDNVEDALIELQKTGMAITEAKRIVIHEPLLPWELFRNEPVWPALLDFRTKLQSTVLSIRLLTRTPEPLWSGTLYTIAKRDYPGLPAWPEFDKFLALHGTDLLGLNAPAADDLKAADVLVKHLTMSNSKRFRLWGDLVKEIDRVIKFHERYVEVNKNEHEDMDYIAHIVRHHLGLPVDSKVSPFGIPQEFAQSEEATGEEMAQDKTQDMLRRIQRVGNMRHVEILEILDQTVESITQNEFAINYYKLDWEVQNFVAFLREEMAEKGLLAVPNRHVCTYLSSQDKDVLLGEVIKAAITRSAEQPSISRVSDHLRKGLHREFFDYKYEQLIPQMVDEDTDNDAEGHD
ncbi:hypothetical protein CKAH01_13864 [Colletotrichum kahawae]|uniref:DUF6604 domain-containing protein n=1 Tax=Colletotrichum kahawae TaxID=34407 RepID=A0AAD9YRE1_COLKA|nr:hypothetical protein CKAH01_13864 [Colletotrichum kahawae]